jgi:transcriptional regulator with XRE-family HTH domain
VPQTRRWRAWWHRRAQIGRDGGLTQEELAARVDPPLSVDAISKLERGLRRPRRATLLALIAALKLGADERAAVLQAWRTPARTPRSSLHSERDVTEHGPSSARSAHAADRAGA